MQTGTCTGILKGLCSVLERKGNTFIFVTAAATSPSPCTHILPITLETVKLSGWITNRRRNAPSPCAHILPITLETVKLSGWITNRCRHTPSPHAHILPSDYLD